MYLSDGSNKVELKVKLSLRSSRGYMDMNFHGLHLAIFKCKSHREVIYFIRDKANREVFCQILFSSSLFVLNKNTGFYGNNELALDVYFKYT